MHFGFCHPAARPQPWRHPNGAAPTPLALKRMFDAEDSSSAVSSATQVQASSAWPLTAMDDDEDDEDDPDRPKESRAKVSDASSRKALHRWFDAVYCHIHLPVYLLAVYVQFHCPAVLVACY